MKKRITALITAIAAAVSAVSFAAITSSAVENGINAADTVRLAEQLDRGLVAMLTEDGVYLSWRMYADEDAVYGTSKTNVTYDIYRDGKPIAYDVDVTNYIDADGTTESEYQVIKSFGDIKTAKKVKPFASGSNYFDINVNKPKDVTLADGNKYSYTINDCSCGDLDGDGEYEIIVKWDCNGKDNSQDGYTGNVFLDAYKMNGDRLWRIDLGQNIRAGAHYTQFLVYDFDGDGKAEITAQTAHGSKGSDGKYVTKTSHIDTIAASTDSDNQVQNVGANGKILTGDEFLTIFNGETGVAIDTIYYPNQRVSVTSWGDKDEGYGNRCDRFTADVAYLDGEKPYAVYMRGYYMRQNGGKSERQTACGVSFDGERLECKYSFDTYDVSKYGSKATSSSYFSDGTYKGVDGYVSGNEIYVGQGNHNCTVADVDGDGKDEVLTGALCYEVKDNNTLGVKWCTFLEHGDALHIGDYDPTHEGYEFFAVHEDGNGIGSTDTEEVKAQKIAGPDGIEGTDDDYGYISANAAKVGKNVICNFGMSVIDPATGDILFHKGNTKDTGRGVMANTGAGGYYQFSGSADMACYGNGDFRAISGGTGSNFRIFWDGDLYDNLLDGISVTDWNGSRMTEIFNASGCVSVNGTKNNPALQADLFGDWREELVYPTSDSSALRVYTTDIYTQYKMKSLMYDSVYRSGVAAEQTAYNQPPHIGYYLDIENTPHTTPNPETQPKTLYEKGTATAAWKTDGSDINDWTQTNTETAQLAYDSENKRILYDIYKPGSSYSASKTFTPSSDASTLTYDIDWFFGSAAGSKNYEYIQFGSNFRLGWGNGGYNLFASTNAGSSYDAAAVWNGTNNTYTKNINVEIDLKTNTIKSITFDGKKLTAYTGASISDPAQLSFGYQKGGNSNTWNYPCGISKIVVSETAEQEKPVLTPRPALSDTTPTPVPATLPPTEQPTICSPIPSVTPSATPTTTPIITITPIPSVSPSVSSSPVPATLPPTEQPTICSPTPSVTPSATPTETDKAGYIADYNFENKYATIHCGVDRESSLVLFASYEDGRLVSIKTVPMPMQKGTDRKPRAKDFENGETVKIFVWDTLEHQEPLMEAKEFSR